MCGDVQLVTASPTAMQDLEVPPEIPDCPAHITKTASLEVEQPKPNVDIDCNSNEIALLGQPQSQSQSPCPSPSSALAIPIPDYLRYEIISEDNTVTLKGNHVLQQVIETESSRTVDTVLSMKDGQIGAHRMVLSAASPFLQAMFEEQQESRIINVVLPDISKKTMDTLLNIAYTGKLTYSESEEDDVFAAIETLRFCEFVELTQKKVPKRLEFVEERPNSPIPCCSRSITSPEFTNESPTKKKKRKHKSKKVPDTPAAAPKVESHINILRHGYAQCKICFQKFRSYNFLTQHLEKVHNVQDRSMLGTFEELQKIISCKSCSIQHETITQIQSCLEGQNLSRCWICLDDIPKGTIRRHYQTMHGDPAEKEFYIKCRWCPKVTNVSHGVAALTTHCVNYHFPELEESKKRKRLSGSDGTGASSSNLLPQSKRERKELKLKSKYNPAEFGPDNIPPFFVGFKEETRNVVFNMNYFPTLSIPLPGIPKHAEEIYMAKLMREWESVEQERKEKENQKPILNSDLKVNILGVDQLEAVKKEEQISKLETEPMDVDQTPIKSSPIKACPEFPETLGQVTIYSHSLSVSHESADTLTANKVVDLPEIPEP